MFRAAFPRISPSSVSGCRRLRLGVLPKCARLRPARKKSRRSLLLPARHPGPDGAACKGGDRCAVLSAVAGIRQRKQAAPQCRARRRVGSHIGPSPHGRLMGNRRRWCFDPVLVTGRRKFGSVIVFAARLAQVGQEAEPSLRTERDLTALSLRLVRLTWAVLRILAFHAT